MILHLTRKEKFTKPFIDFIKENFDISEHFFLLVGGQNKKEFYIEDDSYIKTISNKKDFLKYFIEFNKKMYKADKIIIHGLSQPYNIFYLFLNPWLLKKCYWAMWGGDFYFPEKQSWIKKQVIKKMGHLISGYIGEYELAKKWYGTKGKFHASFLYPSNLYKDIKIQDKKLDTINILLGNSASQTNQHLDALKKLIPIKDKEIKIYTPLSYGDSSYAKEICVKGKEIFGDKFIPLLEFMPFDEYLLLLSEIDIGFFNHNRQQAAGNIISLLGMGKKVYMRNDNTLFLFLKDILVEVYDLEKDIELCFSEVNKKKNIDIIKKYFSKDNLIKQWKDIFENDEQ